VEKPFFCNSLGIRSVTHINFLYDSCSLNSIPAGKVFYCSSLTKMFNSERDRLIFKYCAHWKKMEHDTAKFKRPVELSPSLVARRLSRLEKVGVLRKIHSSADPRLKPSKTVACFACWAIFATDPTIVFQFDKFLEYRIIGKRAAAWFITPRHPSNLDMS